MEVKGKMICKKSDNKAFKLGDDWYNVNTPVIPFLEKINKGDEIVVTFEKKGVARYVSKLVGAESEPQVEEEKTSSTGFTCAVCGAKLKDDRFKVCYMCNKKGLKPKGKVEEEVPKVEKKNYESKSYYGSPEDIAGKEVGCALGAAATVASSQQFNDPETAKQFTLILADEFLTWIRERK